MFTAASVQTVRNPAFFDIKKSETEKFLHSDPEVPRYVDRPNEPSGRRATEEDYKIANHVMTIFANRSEKPVSVWRGIRIPDDPAFLEGLKPGIEFQTWPISSYSKKEIIAQQFTELGKKENEEQLIIETVLSKGTYIDTWSLSAGEHEFVSSSKLIITHHPRRNGPYIYLRCSEIT